ncbi:MAG: hypothetical protein QF506_03945 [Candidatus Woesearchaeota archaeon]|jgi:hypothetical protein|nr:hypothetical protein [Candidatus Woesearchaeota archaeon]|tara:strand:- start:35 stop:157 length:123 start_codon:yes stop_codon:yes gene_type:complete
MFWKKKIFVDWDDYMEKIALIDDYVFRQNIRRANIRNLDT